MRDVYLDFRLPWPAKIAAGMLTPEKWWSFEIYLSVTWNALTSITHMYLDVPNAELNGFFTKTKEASVSYRFTWVEAHRLSSNGQIQRISVFCSRQYNRIFHSLQFYYATPTCKFDGEGSETKIFGVSFFSLYESVGFVILLPCP
jgi:hypothetical protein